MSYCVLIIAWQQFYRDFCFYFKFEYVISNKKTEKFYSEYQLIDIKSKEIK